MGASLHQCIIITKVFILVRSTNNPEATHGSKHYCPFLFKNTKKCSTKQAPYFDSRTHLKRPTALPRGSNVWNQLQYTSRPPLEISPHHGTASCTAATLFSQHSTHSLRSCMSLRSARTHSPQNILQLKKSNCHLLSTVSIKHFTKNVLYKTYLAYRVSENSKSANL